MAIVDHFTEEEKELDKEEMIEMLLLGTMSQAEIARQLGRTPQYISRLKKQAINEKLVTQEEIDLARQNAQDIKNSEKKVNKKEIERQEKKSKVLDRLLAKKTALEIVNELDIPSSTVNRYIDELVDEKKIKREDIVTQREKNREIARNRNEAILTDVKSGKYHTYLEIAQKYDVSEALISKIANGKYEELITQKSVKPAKKAIPISNPEVKLSEDEKQVLFYLDKGYTYNFIEKKLKKTQKELLKIINDLKIVGATNSEKIRRAREEKIQNDEEEVIIYLKRGFSQADILFQKEEFNVAYLSRMVTKLKNEGRITDEEIKEALEQDEDKIEFQKLVLKGMNEGLTVKQIIESDENKYATERRVRNMEDYLISTGQISKKKFDRNRKKNQKNARATRYNELDKQIYDLIKQGVTPIEMAACLHLKRDFIYNRQKLILKRKKVSKEKILEFRKKREKIFSDARIMAKKENDEDSDSIALRTNFLKLAKAEISYGNSLQETDVELLGRFIIINDKLLTKENLRLVILQYIHFGNYQKVEKFISTLIMLYGDTEYGESLKFFYEFARKKLVLSKRGTEEDEYPGGDR